MTDKPVSSLMTTPVATVRADDTVEQVGEELRRKGLSFAPVVESPDGPPLGIITAADLLQFQVAKRDPTSVQAWQICSYRPIEVTPDTPIGQVAKLMIERRIHHVVVMEHNVMKGIVSSLDFVRQFVPQDE
jgi:CBS domain-containing protein